MDIWIPFFVLYAVISISIIVFMIIRIGPRKEFIDEINSLVKKGVLTQERADWILKDDGS